MEQMEQTQTEVVESNVSTNELVQMIESMTPEQKQKLASKLKKKDKPSMDIHVYWRLKRMESAIVKYNHTIKDITENHSSVIGAMFAPIPQLDIKSIVEMHNGDYEKLSSRWNSANGKK